MSQFMPIAKKEAMRLGAETGGKRECSFPMRQDWLAWQDVGSNETGNKQLLTFDVVTEHLIAQGGLDHGQEDHHNPMIPMRTPSFSAGVTTFASSRPCFESSRLFVSGV